MNERFESLMQQLDGLRIVENADMSRYTSFRTGGRATLLVETQNGSEVLNACEEARRLGVRYYVIGRGTNILVSDRGLDALVIIVSDGMSSIEREGAAYSVEAGTSFAAFAKRTVTDGFMGLEWATGIPGSIGGAIAMNASAYNGELKDVLKSVEYIEHGKKYKRRIEAEDLGYRTSVFCAPERIVLRAVFILNPDDGGATERMREYTSARREKQPLNYPSAGSTFKRPEGTFAGKLIEDAGLKGMSVGGAQVSTLHAGFIINADGATSTDIYELIRLVQQRVFDNSGIMLETEVKLLGSFE